MDESLTRLNSIERFVDMSAFSTTEEDLTFISNSILTAETKDNFLRIILFTALGKEICADK
jgi:hypothetical protein